jgi:hypothetical protein
MNSVIKTHGMLITKLINRFICEKDQQDAPLYQWLLQLNYPLHVFIVAPRILKIH